MDILALIKKKKQDQSLKFQHIFIKTQNSVTYSLFLQRHQDSD